MPLIVLHWLAVNRQWSSRLPVVHSSYPAIAFPIFKCRLQIYFQMNRFSYTRQKTLRGQVEIFASSISLLSTILSKALFQWSLKLGFLWERVNLSSQPWLTCKNNVLCNHFHNKFDMVKIETQWFWWKVFTHNMVNEFCHKLSIKFFFFFFISIKIITGCRN